MCRPFNKNPRYYYPGRPFVLGVCLSSLLLLPYALNPESIDSWYLARVFFLPVCIYHFTILLFVFFGNIMKWERWRGPMLAIGMPMFAGLLIAVFFAVWEGDQIGTVIDEVVVKSTIWIVGIIISVMCLTIVTVVFIWAARFDRNEYSNREDLPVNTARKWVALVSVNMIAAWSTVFFCSRMTMEIVQLFFSVAQVVFIIIALHPQRQLIPEDPQTEAEAETETETERTVSPSPAGEQMYQRTISPKTRQEILDAIHTVVVEQKAFLDPHLTLQDVATRTGYNRTYITGLIKSEYGGFFTYINHLRLNHVEDYQKANPDATIQEAALESGFNSRQAYYAVRSALNR